MQHFRLRSLGANGAPNVFQFGGGESKNLRLFFDELQIHHTSVAFTASRHGAFKGSGKPGRLRSVFSPEWKPRPPCPQLPGPHLKDEWRNCFSI